MRKIAAVTDPHRSANPDRSGARVSSSGARTAMVAVLTALALTWFLRETFVVTMPLTAAMFVTAVIWPVYRAIARRLPWGALPATMAVVSIATLLFFGAIATAVAFAIQSSPQYVTAGQDLWKRFVARAEHFGMPADQLTLNTQGELPDWVRNYITYGLTSLWSLVGFMVLVFFFAALMLAETRRWSAKTQAAFETDRARTVIDAARAIARKVRAYLLTQTFIALTSGVLQGTFLWLMRVPLAPAWGLLFFVLEFIPNVGPALALFPPVFVMLATKGVWWASGSLAGIVLIETFIGYVLSPHWQGKNLAISPVVVLLSVVFWGWVWGVVGAVLAVPLTATLLIAFAHVESLRPIALMLSTTSSHRELDRESSPAPAVE